MTDSRHDEAAPEGEATPQDTVAAQDKVEPRDEEANSPLVEEPVYQTNGTVVGLIVAAIVGLGLAFRWSLTLTILGVVAMITIHELGHYLAAKWAGMKVTEFFIGFGPKLWSFKRGETEYGLKPIPAGAYVRIIGMNNLDEVAPGDESRAYRQQSFPKRLVVVLAGPATHFVQAAIIVFLLLAVAGVPGGKLVPSDKPAEESTDWIVQNVTDDSAASAAGLEPGDKVVGFDGNPVATFKDLTGYIHDTEVGENVVLTIQRGDRQFEASTDIVARPENLSGPGAPQGSPFLGIGPEVPATKLGALDALVETPGQTGAVAWEAISALGHFFSPTGLGNFADTVSEGGEEQQTSPQPSSGGEEATDGGDEGRLLSIVGAVRLGADLGDQGWAGLAIFFLSINVFVGLLNLVPLLPFDGGHAAVAIYERIRSRGGERYHADVAKLLPVAYAVVMGLVVLGVTTLYLDIVNPVDF